VTRSRIVTDELDAAEAHATLARHIANLLAGVLRALPQEDRTAAQTELTNRGGGVEAKKPGLQAGCDKAFIEPEREVFVVVGHPETRARLLEGDPAGQ
jgi:hypothetical protein